MEILKLGNPNKVKEYRVFECHKCGCKFKSDNTEYTVIHERHNDNEYKTQCPCCFNNNVYGGFSPGSGDSRDLQI
ncbi:MAG: hypothetical protein FWC41_00565 [Firmicutes bacterium]|nr:hypothetical protein [Bacillota bacterium]